MKYTSRWEGNEKEEIKSGIAVVEVEGKTYFFKLENFTKFIEMDKMIQAAYLGGSEDAIAKMQGFLNRM